MDSPHNNPSEISSNSLGDSRLWPHIGDIQHIDESNHKLFYTLRSLYFLGIALMLLYIPLHYYFGAVDIVFLNLFSVAVFVFCLWINQRGGHLVSVAIGALLVNVHSVFTAHFYGWNSGFYLYLFLVGTAVFLHHRSPIIFRVGGLLLTACFLLLIHHTSEPLVEGFGDKEVLLTYVLDLNLLTVLISLALISFYYAATTHNTELSLIELSNKLKVHAETDPLSQMTNRRGMENILAEMDKQQKRNNMAIALIDIDHFKRINDSYGHPIGDEVIKRVAEVIKENIRTSDYASRWGGEEFLLCLETASPEGASRAMEKLRAEIRAIPFAFEHAIFSTSVTIGVAHMEKGISIDQCIKQADSALYYGKHHGRDQVVDHASLT